MSKVPEHMWKINERRLELFDKRFKRALSEREEKEYKQLTRKVNEFIRKTFPESRTSINSLNRSPFTAAGQMVQIIRKRNKVKK